MEIRAEAAKYLKESSSRSSSSFSHRNSRSYERKPGNAKDKESPAFKQNFQWKNVIGMEPRITDTLPRERGAHREENKPHVRVETNRNEDIEKMG